MAALVFEQVSKSFGRQAAVREVTLEIGAGEIFSLLGPSGCGKTTLLRMAAGFISPDTGRILLEGQDITQLPPEKRPVNTVFQNYALFPHLSAWDNIAFGPRMAGVKGTELRSRVQTMLELIQLPEHAHKKPAELSGGQRQRIAIARALINRPRVLLLDEPLAALDLKLRQHMLAELRRIHAEVGCTFVFVTHDQSEAISLSDRLAVMNAGRIEQTDTPRAIYDEPATSFVASFIGSTNFLTGRVTAGNPTNIRLQGMESLPLPAPSGLPEGRPVRVSIRPEDWWIELKGGESKGVSAVVEEVVFLGPHLQVTVTAGGMRVVIHQPSRLEGGGEALRRGMEVRVGFDPDDAMVLPHEG